MERMTARLAPRTEPLTPPLDDAKLPDYIVDFLVGEGMSRPMAEHEVAGFEPWQLRPTANYAYESSAYLYTVRNQRRTAHTDYLLRRWSAVILAAGAVYAWLSKFVGDAGPWWDVLGICGIVFAFSFLLITIPTRKAPRP